MRRELVNEQPRAAEEDISNTLHIGKAIIHIACRYQELVFAYLHHLSRL